MAKRFRDTQARSFEEQLKSFKPNQVNTLSMMDAAQTAHDQQTAGAAGGSVAQQQQQQHFEQQCISTYQTGHLGIDQQLQQQQQQSFGVPCAQCGCGLSELCMRQCHACKNVYCSSCSVVNYDAREDRVFCLDCTPAVANTCPGHSDGFDMHDNQDYDLPFHSCSTSSAGQDCIASNSSSRSSSLVRACSMAAAAAAAHNSSTPFGCIAIDGFRFCASEAAGAAAMAPWDGSPPSWAAGQLLATSPVIPFVGLGCNQGYMGLANRVCGAAAAAVSGC